jgi:chromate transport protein ChrA
MTSSKNHINWQYLTIKLGAQIIAILVLAAVANLFRLPISVVASAALTVIMTILLINSKSHLGKKQVVGLVWFTLAALTLCVLFVISEFVSPIRVTVLYIAILLLPPLFLMKGGRKPKA